jgi:hypothetical protein
MLTAQQRNVIRTARDEAVRRGWSPRSVGDIEDGQLRDVLDGEQWRTAAQIGERLGIGASRAVLSPLGRRLAGMDEVEVWRRSSVPTVYRLRT